MTYNPDIHHRRSIRLKKFDYTQTSTYFITICSYQKSLIFGKIHDQKIILNELGETINKCWLNLANHYKNIVLGQFIIMPNHIHGIFSIKNYKSLEYKTVTLTNVIRTFKSESSCKCNKIRNKKTEPLWQRNYYERIIRNTYEHDSIVSYIANNPLNWEKDSCFKME